LGDGEARCREESFDCFSNEGPKFQILKHGNNEGTFKSIIEFFKVNINEKSLKALAPSPLDSFLI
jgi:hypothetical protein